MTDPEKAMLIAITWGVLLVLYAFGRLLQKHRPAARSVLTLDTEKVDTSSPPGTLLSKAGVLWVFGANIVSLFLLFIEAWYPAMGGVAKLLMLRLPAWLEIVGTALFLLITVWGLFAMLYNPTYTPLYRLPPHQFALATRGPYAIIRHPRYTAEALLNIALFLLTGMWLPLLGVIGWAAVVSQARAEERFLMKLAPRAYANYQRKTGMFFPLLKRRGPAKGK